MVLATALLIPASLRAEPHPERLPQLMDRLAKSQGEMDTKQDMLLTYAKRNIASDRTKVWVEERLRDLVTCQERNTALYQDYRATLQAAGASAASAAPRVAALEEAQSKLGANHMTLSQFFGPFWERAGHGAPNAPAAPTTTLAAAPVAAAPMGAAVPANLLAPMPGTPPPFGGQPAAPAADSGPASSTDAPAPIVTSSDPVAPQPPPPDDGEAAYKKQLTEIQATMANESATPDARQKAYQQFLKLKTTRRERFK